MKIYFIKIYRSVKRNQLYAIPLYMHACMLAMFYFMEEIKCSTGISNISLFFPVQGIRICSKNKKHILTVSSYTFSIIHIICKQTTAFKIFTVFSLVTPIPSATNIMQGVHFEGPTGYISLGDAYFSIFFVTSSSC